MPALVLAKSMKTCQKHQLMKKNTTRRKRAGPAEKRRSAPLQDLCFTIITILEANEVDKSCRSEVDPKFLAGKVTDNQTWLLTSSTYQTGCSGVCPRSRSLRLVYGDLAVLKLSHSCIALVHLA